GTTSFFITRNIPLCLFRMMRNPSQTKNNQHHHDSVLSSKVSLPKHDVHHNALSLNKNTPLCRDEYLSTRVALRYR
ncbi:MAG: hypothetical protein MJ136_04460, partial [Clostridia bacterium]|nr:hypothetical protein [Clostridia bacterium]